MIFWELSWHFKSFYSFCFKKLARWFKSFYDVEKLSWWSKSFFHQLFLSFSFSILLSQNKFSTRQTDFCLWQVKIIKSLQFIKRYFRVITVFIKSQNSKHLRNIKGGEMKRLFFFLTEMHVNVFANLRNYGKLFLFVLVEFLFWWVVWGKAELH